MKFKVFVISYIVFFLLISCFVPTTTYFDGYVYKDGPEFSQNDVNKKTNISYEVSLSPIFLIGYETVEGYTEMPDTTELYVRGNIIRKIQISMLVLEILSLSVVYSGIGLIILKKKIKI